jgi:hydrogenase expression/formation protein HypC
MCVGVPSKIVKIDDFMAVIDVEGAQREVSLLLLDKPAEIGDYVIVHAGFAIKKIHEKDARENLRLMKKMFGVEEMVPPATRSKKRRKNLRVKVEG